MLFTWISNITLAGIEMHAWFKCHGTSLTAITLLAYQFFLRVTSALRCAARQCTGPGPYYYNLPPLLQLVTDDAKLLKQSDYKSLATDVRSRVIHFTCEIVLYMMLN